MTYSVRQLSNQKWGIYTQDKLLATCGCHQKSLAVLELLIKRNRIGFPTYRHSV